MATTVLYAFPRKEPLIHSTYVEGKFKRPATRGEVVTWLRDPDAVPYRVVVGLPFWEVEV